MNKWQVVGSFMILLGVVILALLSGFILNILIDLLQLVAVFIGIILVVAGVALLVGHRWMRSRPWSWGPPPSST